jgi:AraC-like DNA-binding protein
MEIYPASTYFRDPDFPLDLRSQHNHRPLALHAHEFSEIAIVTSGAGIHFTPDREYTITVGDVFVLQGKDAHGYRNTRNLVLFNLLFDPGILHAESALLENIKGYQALFSLEPRYRREHQFAGHLRMNADSLRQVETLLGRLEGELSTRPTGYKLMAHSLFIELVILLSRFYSRADSAPATVLLKLEHLLQYFEALRGETIPLERMAREANMSVSTLLRSFKKATGYSPIEYLINNRVAHAQRLLRETEHSITEVAFQSGFNDSNYFARQFRKRAGRSPREFRLNA